MEHFYQLVSSLSNDMNMDARLLLGLLHLPLVIVLMALIRHERYFLLLRTQRSSAVYVLKEFYRCCYTQYRASSKCLQLIKKEKQEINEQHFKQIGKAEDLQRLWTILLQHSSILLYQEQYLKTASVLMALRDRVSFQQLSVPCLLQGFDKEYTAQIEIYYNNISNLAAMYDVLQENISRKVINKGNDPDWAKRFLEIFRQWQQQGSNKDIDTCYHEIIEPIALLQQLYRDIPFILQAGEIIIRCQTAYQRISQLLDTLQMQLNSFAWQHRLACRIINVVLKKADVKTVSLTITTPVKRISIRGFWQLRKKLSCLTQFETRILQMRAIRIVLSVAVCLLVCSLTWITASHWHKPTGDALSYPEYLLSPDSSRLASMTIPDAVSDTDYLYGIDISRYQGKLMEEIDNLDTLHFAICKATEGIHYTDPDFMMNWQFIRRRGLFRGAYHFYHNSEDPVLQGSHFVSVVPPADSLDLPLVVDVEEGSLTGKTELLSFNKDLLRLLQYIEHQTGKKPMLYTNLSFANQYLTLPEFGDYPLWLAEYSGMRTPQLPELWKERNYVIWQRGDNYRIDSKRMDFDVFNGNRDELLAFIRRAGIPGQLPHK